LPRPRGQKALRYCPPGAVEQDRAPIGCGGSEIRQKGRIVLKKSGGGKGTIKPQNIVLGIGMIDGISRLTEMILEQVPASSGAWRRQPTSLTVSGGGRTIAALDFKVRNRNFHFVMDSHLNLREMSSSRAEAKLATARNRPSGLSPVTTAPMIRPAMPL
jgi:hypothetical protein